MERHDVTTGAFTLAGALTSQETDALIALAEGRGFDTAPVSTLRGPVHMPDVRNNTRVMFNAPDLATHLWERLAPWLPPTFEGGWEAIGLNERLRFYRYDPGQRFNLHRDGHFARSADERSFLTLLLYLNGDFVGGQTRFLNAEVQPSRGDALVFEHHLLHEGAPVVAGRKYVLRSDVMYARQPS